MRPRRRRPFHIDREEVNLSVAPSITSLPKILADAVRQGAISMQVAFAIMTGQRDANTLTNLVFYAKHPELPVGYMFQRHERGLAQQWVDIKERIIRPLLQAMGTGPVSAGAPAGPSPTVTAPIAPPRATPSSVNDDRAYRYHCKYGGYSRYGGGRIETRLRELRDQGKLSISDGDIELLQRISHVETGGCVQALNSWDDVYMSIGFMQWPLVFGKLQRLIARAPDAFRRYGIELDPTRRYSIKRSYPRPETPIALKGVGHPSELRSLNWAKRFYAAGLDPEIVAWEAAGARGHRGTAQGDREEPAPPDSALRRVECAPCADSGDKQPSTRLAQGIAEAGGCPV